MLPANKHTDPIIGVDIHIVLIPSPAGPIPTPLPHPFVGMIMDPMDYVPVVGATVWVNKKPRGNSTSAGVLGTKAHIPLGGPHQMAATIGHDSANFFGSPRVQAEGCYMSGSGYMVMSCNDIGAPLTAAPGKKMKPKPGLYMPSSATIPIPGGPPVIVGGPFVPDVMSMLMSLAMSYGMGAMMKGAGKALKKAGQSVKNQLKKLNHKVLKKHKATQGLSKKLCKMGFEPVDLVTGRVMYDGVDFELPGSIPVRWERNWYSDSAYEGMLGHGVHSSYDLQLHIEDKDNVIVMRLADGRLAYFPLLLTEGAKFFEPEEKLTLEFIDRNTYKVTDKTDRREYTFGRYSKELFLLRSIGTGHGPELKFNYGATGRIERLIDTAGRVIDFKTDREGRVTSVTASHRGDRRQLISYKYNDEGDMIAIVDALGKATTIDYKNHLMVRKIDRNGQAFYWEYDGDKPGAKCIKTWGDGGILAGTIEYAKGYNNVYNSFGDKSVYHFNDLNLCTQVSDPEGGHIFHEYTENLDLYRDIDEEGNITGYTYDKQGNMSSIVFPDGSAHTFIYDEEDRLILSKPPDGDAAVRTYENGLISAVVGSDGQLTSYEYNEHGLIESIIDAAGNIRRLEYDQDHNLVKLFTNNVLSSSWRYDAWGQCVETRNAEKQRQQFTYDELNRLTKVLKADNYSVKFKYDAYENVVRSLDSSKSEVNFSYTPMGGLTSREENGRKVEFQYNTEEQLTGVINEREEVYRFGRNKKGEIITEIGYDGIRKDFRRDRSGNVIRIDRPDQRWSEYEYNLNNQVSRIEHYDGHWEVFNYNDSGQMIEAINPNSHVKLERDAGGRIIAEEQGGHRLEYEYDRLGKRTAIKSSLGTDVIMDRDKLGFMSGLSAAKGEEKDTVWQASMKSNSLGMELERALPGGLKVQKSYDLAGRMTGQTVSKGGKAMRKRSYKWSVNDQLREMVDELQKGVVSYNYDAFGALAGARYENGLLDYKLPDAVGNLYRSKNKSDREYGEGSRLLKAGRDTFKYDGEGNLVTKSTPKGDWNYSWYGNGMLKEVTTAEGQRTSFEYDALGRRTAKIAHPRISTKPAKIRCFVWAGNVPMHEWEYQMDERPNLVVDEFGAITRDKEEPVKDLTTWVFEGDSFVPAAKITEQGTFSIVTDHLGTPVEMYDAKGNLSWKVEYDIYGGIRNQLKGQASDCPFRYQGQYEDSETGLNYNRFRYYDSSTGTYICQDPIRLEGRNPNLYAYVVDSNFWIDPFGLNNVATGEGRTHVKYSGVKDGQPYHGYASAPTSEALSGDEILSRRYGGNFDDFDVAPTVDYVGEGVEGKRTARGLEQRGFEADGGLGGTSNRQNPVGPGNANRQNYLNAADQYMSCN